jgi:hypothetical protein
VTRRDALELAAFVGGILAAVPVLCLILAATAWAG